MSDQVSLSPEQQILNLQTELKETQIQLQKLRAAAWGAADSFRKEVHDNLSDCRFVSSPTMFEILWAELDGIPEDLDLLRWAGENELADLREENERLRTQLTTSELFEPIKPAKPIPVVVRAAEGIE